MAVREIILTAQHSTAQHSTAQHSTLTAPFFLSDKGDNLI
jgi:hypothetical protein